MTRTLLITGVSSGLGRAFANAALDAGHTVIGTVRQPAQAGSFARHPSGRAHAKTLEATDTESITSLVDQIESEISPIDVLVNNAGYGVEGTFEETTLPTFRHQFDVNVFGPVALTQAVLPHMRRRAGGHIVFITSMGGLRTFPALSAYHGSKFALEGIAGALADEVVPLGIHVTTVEPGAFRTDWAGRSMVRVNTGIADYEPVIAPLRQRRLDNNGSQPGDPKAAGAALLKLIGSPHPPRHLLLGSDALRLVAESRAAFDAETREWEDVSRSTDYPIQR